MSKKHTTAKLALTNLNSLNTIMNFNKNLNRQLTKTNSYDFLGIHRKNPSNNSTSNRSGYNIANILNTSNTPNAHALINNIKIKGVIKSLSKSNSKSKVMKTEVAYKEDYKSNLFLKLN